MPEGTAAGSVTVTVPANPIVHQLRHLIAGGVAAEDAAEKVLQPYQPAPLADDAWGVVYARAIRIEREIARRTEHNAFAPGVGTSARHAAKLRIATAVFRIGDGPPIQWGKATVAQHQARIAWQYTQRDGIDRDIARHQRAIALITERGVSCLDDIEGWQDLMEDVGTAASAEVAGLPRSTARGAGTSANAAPEARRGAVGAHDVRRAADRSRKRADAQFSED